MVMLYDILLVAYKPRLCNIRVLFYTHLRFVFVGVLHSPVYCVRVYCLHTLVLRPYQLFTHLSTVYMFDILSPQYCDRVR